MYRHVLGDALFGTERFITNVALVVFNVGVNVQVIGEVAFGGKCLFAQVALEFLIVLLVTLNVSFQVTWELELLVADVTCEVFA